MREITPMFTEPALRFLHQSCIRWMSLQARPLHGCEFRDTRDSSDRVTCGLRDGLPYRPAVAFFRLSWVRAPIVAASAYDA